MLSMNGIGKHLSLMIALKKFEKSQEKRRKDKKRKKEGKTMPVELEQLGNHNTNKSR